MHKILLQESKVGKWGVLDSYDFVERPLSASFSLSVSFSLNSRARMTMWENFSTPGMRRVL